jgi:hypothetical protein
LKVLLEKDAVRVVVVMSTNNKPEKEKGALIASNKTSWFDVAGGGLSGWNHVIFWASTKNIGWSLKICGFWW